MAWESHCEKEMIIGKVIFEISRKNDVHNNYETDYNKQLNAEYQEGMNDTNYIYFLSYKGVEYHGTGSLVVVQW